MPSVAIMPAKQHPSLTKHFLAYHPDLVPGGLEVLLGGVRPLEELLRHRAEAGLGQEGRCQGGVCKP